MSKLQDIITTLYELFYHPFDADVLTEQYVRTIRSLITLNGINLNIDYVSFSGNILNTLVSLSRNVILPVGYSILAYLLVMDMYNLYSKAEGMSGTSALHIPLKLIIKTVVFKFIIDRSHDLLEAIHRLILYIQNQTLSYTLDSVVSQQAIESFRNEINGMSFFQKLMLFVEINGYAVLSLLVLLLIYIVVISRIFELYIYIFISPIPLATLPGTELSHIGKNFLKGFTAICLQGLIISLILFLYSQFVHSFAIGPNLKEQFWKGLTAAALLTFCLYKSARWAKSICNSM